MKRDEDSFPPRRYRGLTFRAWESAPNLKGKIMTAEQIVALVKDRLAQLRLRVQLSALTGPLLVADIKNELVKLETELDSLNDSA